MFVGYPLTMGALEMLNAKLKSPLVAALLPIASSVLMYPRRPSIRLLCEHYITAELRLEVGNAGALACYAGSLGVTVFGIPELELSVRMSASLGTFGLDGACVPGDEGMKCRQLF